MQMVTQLNANIIVIQDEVRSQNTVFNFALSFDCEYKQIKFSLKNMTNQNYICNELLLNDNLF
jgi:hypothetical protein